MPDERERSTVKKIEVPFKAEELGFICGSAWMNLGFAQTVLGFSTNGSCEANEDLPTYTGVHGLLNFIYGIGIILLGMNGYKLFVFRLVFLLTWIGEGALCITGFAFYSKTVGYLKGCSTQCKTCNQHLVTGSIVIESCILFLYIVVTFSIIGFEIKTKCKHCKVGDGNGERSHATEPQTGNQFRRQETTRTDETSVSRRSDTERPITNINSRNRIQVIVANNQNMIFPAALPSIEHV